MKNVIAYIVILLVIMIIVGCEVLKREKGEAKTKGAFVKLK